MKECCECESVSKCVQVVKSQKALNMGVERNASHLSSFNSSILIGHVGGENNKNTYDEKNAFSEGICIWNDTDGVNRTVV